MRQSRLLEDCEARLVVGQSLLKSGNRRDAERALAQAQSLARDAAEVSRQRSAFRPPSMRSLTTSRIRRATGRALPETATQTRTCPKCGEDFTPRVGRGRPRKFCPNCTPRSAADKSAAHDHWAEI
jgi:Tfp pilus assembly protein PilX